MGLDANCSFLCTNGWLASGEFPEFGKTVPSCLGVWRSHSPTMAALVLHCTTSEKQLTFLFKVIGAKEEMSLRK